MNYYFYTFVLLIFTGVSFAQDKIQGLIIDYDDGLPIENAVINYGLTKKESTFSDKNGKFTVPFYPDRLIEIQLMGYETKTVLISQLIKDPVIKLVLSPLSLSPVEINANAAKRLLEKAIFNTKSKMIINKNLTYITHIKETEQYSGEKRDFFFKYVALQKKRQPKKQEIDTQFGLIDIKHIDTLPEKPQSLCLRPEYGFTEFHVNKVSDNFEQRYVTISYTEDYALIKLEAMPDKGSFSTIKNTYYINRADTTLHSAQAETIEGRVEKSVYRYDRFSKARYKLLKMKSFINFEEMDDFCYFAGAGYTYVYSYLVGEKEEIIISNMDNKFIKIEDNPEIYKKIKNNARTLYTVPSRKMQN